jgi:hypothetical protein
LDDSEASKTDPDEVQIDLSEIERNELKARERRRKLAGTDATRAAIVFLATDGLNN